MYRSMKVKQKQYRFLGILAFLVVGLSTVTSLAFTSTNVAAWCAENAGFDDICLAENYDSIADKRGVTPEKLKEMARSCTSGNPGGLDFGSVDQGSCINAATSCVQKSVDLNKCTADNMATMAMNSNCNHGKLYSSGSSCDRLKEMNESAFNDAESAATNKASTTCVVSGNETEKYQQREACKNKVTDACSASNSSYGDNKLYNEYQYDSYNQCLNRALKETAKNEAECKARGGVWSDWDSSAKDCYNQYSDLTNATACQKAGGKFTQISQDRWECLDPNSDQAKCADKKGKWNGQSCEDTEEACKSRNANNTWDETTNPQTGQVSHKCSDGGNGMSQNGGNGGTGGTTSTENCGQARTNLIKCNGSGVQAIGDVLRQIIVILTILIGIAAVGGIGYAAILYASATDNASQAQNAISIIRNIVIGILVYGFMIAIINWLVPGSVIG